MAQAETPSKHSGQARICQNCKQDFVIDPEDFNFYKKVRVPAPTFCYKCRMQRRFIFRNERTLYRNKCALCGAKIISIFAPDSPHIVYCQPCWWSDKWDTHVYGIDYDPDRGFFEQFKELQLKTPFMALTTEYSTLINSDYVNNAGNLKNCYLIFNGDFDENVAYGTVVDKVKDSLDINLVGESQLIYDSLNCGFCYNVFFSEDCDNSNDLYFCKDMSGCSHCFGCTNLRQKKYYIWNQPYSKEEYEDKLRKFKLDSCASIRTFRKRALDFWSKFPRKFAQEWHNVNTTGEYAYESKNSQDIYQARFVEDGRFTQFITLPPVKDVYDYTEWGQGAELIYDSIGCGDKSRNVRFCVSSWDGLTDCEYGMWVISSEHTFGCINIRNGKYCILNKAYSRKEFEALRAKIIQDMNERPYTDSTGRVFKYGDFFPYDLSPFAYNECFAKEYFPLSEKQALEAGFKWKNIPAPNQKPTLKEVPDSINDANQSITKEIFACANCGKPHRIIPMEFDILKRLGLPLPSQCQNCRYRYRMDRLNPPFFWNRQCAKCGKDIRTSYSPDRPEMVYCEECYQQEVI